MTKYKVIKPCFAMNSELDAVCEIQIIDDSMTDSFRKNIKCLLAEGYIQEIPPAPATPRLKGMPAMDGYISTICPYGIGSPGKINLGVIQNYPTREAAEESAAWHRARTNLIRAAHRISGGTNGFISREINWNAYLYEGEILVYFEAGRLKQEQFMCFRTEAQVRQFAEECREDLLTYFGVGD